MTLGSVERKHISSVVGSRPIRSRLEKSGVEPFRRSGESSLRHLVIYNASPGQTQQTHTF